MTKKEKIRDWMNKYLTKQFIFSIDTVPEDECLLETDVILAYLHSQGMVLEEERKSSDNFTGRKEIVKEVGKKIDKECFIDEPALNKKISDWLGVSPYAEYPAGYSYPEFTESLDLCLRHIAPELKESLELNVVSFRRCKAGPWSVVLGWNRDEVIDEVVAEHEELPLAFCLAVEKVIDRIEK